MKYIIRGIFIMSVVALSTSPASAGDKDRAAIKTIVESVATLADSRNFEALEKLYAAEVELDYTSLSGGEVELKSPQAIMTQWAGVLPGFDRTRHALSDIQVNISGAKATATAQIVADHYVDDLFWQVTGRYVYRLHKADDAWQITSHAFTLTDEKGSRDVFAPAIKNANANPVSYLIRQQTRQTVMDFLSALEQKDMEKFANTLAEDMIQDMPFSPKGHPKRVSGKKNILELFAAWPTVSGKADFTSELRAYPMIDPQMIFVEYKGNVDIVTTKRRYEQTYGGLFHVEDGKIKLFREYYDPAPFTYAFGLDK